MTASNVIPQNAIASTSTRPSPHEDSNSMDLDALPDRPPVLTASVIPENAIASSSAHPSVHEESTSSNILPPGTPMDLPHRPPVLTASVIPENAIASTCAQPRVHEESTSSNILPLGTPMDLDTQSLPSPPRNSAPVSRHDPRPYGHQPNPQRDRPERYVSHRRRSRDDSPRHLRRRNSRDDSPRRPSHDLQDGGRSLPPRSRSRGPYQSTINAMVTPHTPPDTRIDFGIQSGSVVEFVYHRFGFHLDEIEYTGVPSSATCTVEFSDWVDVIRSIGCHQLSGSLMHRQPIKEFLECLLSTSDPLRDVPSKFWDLNTRNSACLNLAAGPIRIEPKTFLGGKTLYLIHPVGTSRDSSWVLAVDATTALECIRWHLGPHTTDVADFLINRGICFSTLQSMTSIPGPHTPPRPISNLLGTRPINYWFNLGDFSSYQSICESVLKSKPFCRAALCMGGIVARLARDIIPISAALLGPSPDALDGSQEILVSGGELFCDDKLSETYADLICGVYEIPTAHRSMYTINLSRILLISTDQVSKMSWFPKHNVWVQAGYNVGWWTEECEEWFKKRMTEIQEGGQPFDSHTWRSKLLLSRKATKLVRKMDIAATSFIQAQSLGGS